MTCTVWELHQVKCIPPDGSRPERLPHHVIVDATQGLLLTHRQTDNRFLGARGGAFRPDVFLASTAGEVGADLAEEISIFRGAAALVLPGVDDFAIVEGGAAQAPEVEGLHGVVNGEDVV